MNQFGVAVSLRNSDSLTAKLLYLLDSFPVSSGSYSSNTSELPMTGLSQYLGDYAPPPPPFTIDELANPGPFYSARVKADLLDTYDVVVEAQISELEAVVKTHEAVLAEAKLRKKSLSLLLAASRTFRAPIRMLPQEILSEIFLLYAQPNWLSNRSDRHILGTNFYAIQLLRVCRLWRTVAMNTPGLWEFLDLVEPTVTSENPFIDVQSYVSLSRGSAKFMRLSAEASFFRQCKFARGGPSPLMAPQNFLTKLSHLHLLIKRDLLTWIMSSEMILLPSLVQAQISASPPDWGLYITPRFDVPSLKQLIIKETALFPLLRLTTPLDFLQAFYNGDSSRKTGVSDFVFWINKSAPQHIELLASSSGPSVPNAPSSLPTTKTVTMRYKKDADWSWHIWTRHFLRGCIPLLEELNLHHDTPDGFIPLNYIFPLDIQFRNIKILRIHGFFPYLNVCGIFRACFPSLESLFLTFPDSTSTAESDIGAFFSGMSIVSLDPFNPRSAPVCPRLTTLSVSKHRWVQTEMGAFVDMIYARTTSNTSVFRLDTLCVRHGLDYEGNESRAFLGKLAALYSEHSIQELRDHYTRTWSDNEYKNALP